MRRHPRALTVALAIAIIAISAGCGWTRGQPDLSHPPLSGARFDQQARHAVAAWPTAPLAALWRTGLFPLQNLTVIPVAHRYSATYPHDPIAADDELILRDAIEMGEFKRRITAWPSGPARGRIALPDGSGSPVAIESAHDALSEFSFRGESPEPACGHSPLLGECALTITGVTYGTTAILTNRGEAVVPAWLFTVKELSQPIARVAVARTAWTRIEQALTGPTGVESVRSIDGTTITYGIVVHDCGQAIRSRVYETPTAVVIGYAETPDKAAACSLVGSVTTISVVLAAPLGNRPMLDAISGCPARIDLSVLGPISAD